MPVKQMVMSQKFCPDITEKINTGGGGVKKAAQAFKKPLGNKKEERLQKYERK